jgi:hypothetical protein
MHSGGAAAPQEIGAHYIVLAVAEYILLKEDFRDKNPPPETLSPASPLPQNDGRKTVI